MISCDLFDKIEYIARVIRRNDDPFGEIQIVYYQVIFVKKK